MVDSARTAPDRALILREIGLPEIAPPVAVTGGRARWRWRVAGGADGGRRCGVCQGIAPRGGRAIYGTSVQ